MTTHEEDLTALAEAVGVLTTQHNSENSDHQIPAT